MKKNLKKVISAIAALALSTSSFVALAVDFPDVPDTADYAKAVDQLTGMGIVEGDPDGTFQPDRAVTRAEMTTMIIRALGSEAAATSMAGRDTNFRDVDHNHWAAGYVAVANTINPQFIQGMGDGTFAPDATVTYAQAVTMLVRSLGYESMAAPSGYPNGYLAQAGAIGMLDGFSIPSNDTELNRGQVAILIDNATVNCPILGEGEWQQGIMGGSYAPEVKDGAIPGQGNFWKSLATTKHNTYQVYGRVTGTKLTDSTTDADEVLITVMRSRNFDGFSFGFGYDSSSATKYPRADVGDTDAAAHLNQYAEMLIEDTGDDEYVLLAYTPTDGNTRSLEFATNQYNDKVANTITFTNESGTNPRNYDLSPTETTYYVNGYKVADWAAAQPYITNNYVGNVTLLDYQGEPVNGNRSNGADGKYDDVMITYYQDAVVNEVVVDRAGEVTITFDETDGIRRPQLKFDPADEDRMVAFTGDATSYEELEQYDVLSIQTKPGVTDLSDEDVTAVVSKNKVTGTVSRNRKNDVAGGWEYFIGDDSYVANVGIFGDSNGDPVLVNSTEYTLSLDAFGYIAHYEEGASSRLYGIVDGMFTAEGGSTYRVRLVEADGSVNTYDYYKQSIDEFRTAAEQYAYNKPADAELRLDGTDTRKNVMERVVNYTITSGGDLRISGLAEDMTEAVDSTYQLSSNRVGSVRFNENTNVLDLTDYVDKDGEQVTGSTGDISVMGSFQADSEYTVVGYGKSKSDSTFSFAIVLSGVGGIGIDSPMAVVNSVSSTDYGDGETTLLSVYTNGDLEDLVVDIDATTYAQQEAPKFNTGDVFVYELSTDNRIKTIAKVYHMNGGNYTALVRDAFDTASNVDNFNDLVDGANGSQFDACINDDVPVSSTLDDTDENGKLKYQNFNKGKGEFAFFTFGPVISTTGGVTIATLNHKNDNLVSYMDVKSDYSFDSDSNVYLYDFDQKYESQRTDLASKTSVQKTSTSNKTLYADGNNGDYIDWTLDYNYDGSNAGKTYGSNDIAFALLKIDSNSITEGYTIIPPTRAD